MFKTHPCFWLPTSSRSCDVLVVRWAYSGVPQELCLGKAGDAQVACFALLGLVQTVWLSLFRGYGLPHETRFSWADARRFCLLKGDKLFCVSRQYAWLQRDWSLFLRTAVFLATVRQDVLLQCGKFFCGTAAGCFATERYFLLRQSGRMFCYMAASSFVAARHDVLLYRGRLVETCR